MEKTPGFMQTVDGPCRIAEIGLILPHEHLFIDLRNQFTEFADPEEARISRQPVSTEHLDRLSRNPYAVRDNLLLDSAELIEQEVACFTRQGGGALIECTSIGIHRDPRALRDFSRRTGVPVIAGCGYYTADTHPAELASWSADEIAAVMLRDLTEGMDGTDIRAGVIGELGTSNPVHPDEWKVLTAAALTFAQYPAPIYVHTYPWATHGLPVAAWLLARGVAPEQLVICHTDVALQRDYIHQLLACGVFVEFDNFGKEFPIEDGASGFAGGRFAMDRERVATIRELVEEGYAAQLLLCNDICLKSMLHAYGGHGYDHILTNIVPQLHTAGLSGEIIDQILCKNPQQLLGG